MAGLALAAALVVAAVGFGFGDRSGIGASPTAASLAPAGVPCEAFIHPPEITQGEGSLEVTVRMHVDLSEIRDVTIEHDSRIDVLSFEPLMPREVLVMLDRTLAEPGAWTVSVVGTTETCEGVLTVREPDPEPDPAPDTVPDAGCQAMFEPASVSRAMGQAEVLATVSEEIATLEGVEVADRSRLTVMGADTLATTRFRLHFDLSRARVGQWRVDLLGGDDIRCRGELQVEEEAPR